MPTLSANANITLSLTDYDSVTVSCRGPVLVEAVSGLGVSAGKLAEVTGTRTFGPFTPAGSLKLTAYGNDAQYEIADGVAPSAGGPGTTAIATASAVGAVKPGVGLTVAGDGTMTTLAGVGATITATGTFTLPGSALGVTTPVSSATAVTLTLPSAATAFASNPFGLIVISQLGAGVPTFAAGAGDTLRATSGIPACVQYGMIAAQVISANEWALA